MEMKIRALVFEDEASVRGLLNHVLKSRGYEVVDFEDPSQCALSQNDACVNACADILISDVRMPRISGLDFVEMQRSRGCPLRNVALISGDWNTADVERAKAAGCAVIRKPFTISELTDWLDTCEKDIDPERVLSDGPLKPA